MATDSTSVSNPTSVVVNTQKKTTVRVPNAAGGKGSQVIKRDRTQQERRAVLYPDTTSSAMNLLANLPESKITSIQQRLYEAGFYDSTDIVMYGRRRPEDATALGRAMAEANMRGEKWESAADFRISMNYAGIKSAQAAGTSGGGSGGRGKSASPAGQLQITGPKNARATLDSLTRKYAGAAKATDADFADAYDKLVKAQTAAPIKYGTQKIKGKYYTVQLTDGVNAEDFLEQYIVNKINFGSDEIGGIAGQNILTIKEDAKAYGLALSTNELSQWAKSMTDGSMDQVAVRKKLVERSKAKFKSLANDISETVPVYDLVSDFINARASTLEESAKSLGVEDVAEAISGEKAMTTSEYIASLKKRPEYGYTQQARTNAATFAVNLASTLGFGGQ